MPNPSATTEACSSSLASELALQPIGMRNGKAERDAARQRDRGGDNAARRQKKTYEKDSFAVHRTTFGVLWRAVQTEIMMGH